VPLSGQLGRNHIDAHEAPGGRALGMLPERDTPLAAAAHRKRYGFRPVALASGGRLEPIRRPAVRLAVTDDAVRGYASGVRD
jgi:hypothetical protein